MTAESGVGIHEGEPRPCVFCEIRDGKEVASKITENANALAIMALEGHVLVIPKPHITAENLSDHIEELVEAFRFAQSLIPSVKEGLNATGISAVINLGESAGQEVSHVHIHLIDRTQGDRKIRYPSIQRLNRNALNELAANIKSKIK